eukprot:m.124331 g.124331  ORF g.124331 m.124331 type:complete len:56 (+) comp37846_c0_seq15:109-276(+)
MPHLVATDQPLGSSTYRPNWIQSCLNENTGNCDAELDAGSEGDVRRTYWRPNSCV